MTAAEIVTIVLGALSLLGTAVSVWLKLTIRADLADHRAELLEYLSEHYVRMDEVCRPARESIERRLERLEARPAGRRA